MTNNRRGTGRHAFVHKNSFLYEITPISNSCENENDRVASPEIAPLHFKYDKKWRVRSPITWGNYGIVDVDARTRARCYKTFFCSTQLSMKFSPLINVKMPTLVGILTFMSRKNSILGLSEPEKC